MTVSCSFNEINMKVFQIQASYSEGAFYIFILEVIKPEDIFEFFER